MTDTGMIRKIDGIGRICVPKEIRTALNIKLHDPLKIFVNGRDLIFRPELDCCVICGKTTNLTANLNGYEVCGTCMDGLERSYKNDKGKKEPPTGGQSE